MPSHSLTRNATASVREFVASRPSTALVVSSQVTMRATISVASGYVWRNWKFYRKRVWRKPQALARCRGTTTLLRWALGDGRDLIGSYLKAPAHMQTEGIDERDRVTAAQQRACRFEARCCADRKYCHSPPINNSIHEIHRIDNRYANVAKMTVHASGRNVERSANVTARCAKSRQTPSRSLKVSNAVRVERACM